MTDRIIQARSIDPVKLLGLLVIAALSTAVAVLTVQNKSLKEAMAPKLTSLAHGDNAANFRVTTMEGGTDSIRFSGGSSHKHLLFILSTTCPHCHNTLPAWNALAERFKEECGVAGVSVNDLERTRKYRDTSAVQFPIVSLADSMFAVRYKLTGYPVTMVIREDGTVEQSWVGELQPGQLKEIERRVRGS